MHTKQKILEEALTLFSQKGFRDVFVGEIADAVGIKAPSLYKHFKSKQDIFDAILEEMKSRYEKQTQGLGMDGNDPNRDVPMFLNISVEHVKQMGKQLFLYFLHDDYVQKFRKMMSLEQYHNSELGFFYSTQYFNEPIAYQAQIFSSLVDQGGMKEMDSEIMALHFYAPIYALLVLCDRQAEREEDALRMLERHIEQFAKLYAKE